MNSLNYRRKTLLLLALATLFRMGVAAFTELGNDEVYYRLYADPLQWNYFDHPPAVGWLIRLSTFNLLADSGFFIRLGAIACAAGSTWLMYRSGEALAGPRAGYYAAALYTAALYSSIIAGTFILPDSPQMLCWTAALLLLIRIAQAGQVPKKHLLLFGLVAGLGMLCKIHTVFLWMGLGLFILLYRRHWLRHGSLYAAAALTLLLFVPVISWNIRFDFITFRYHGERVDVSSGGLRLDYFGAFAAGQILYCNPLVFFILLQALRKRSSLLRHPAQRTLLLTGLPLIMLATSVSLFRELLPHWTGPGFVTLMLPAAAVMAARAESTGWRPVLLRAALVFTAAIMVAGTAFINLFPGTLGKQEPARRGYGDFTLDMHGWRSFAPVFDSIYRSTHPDGRVSGTVIVADEWFPAAHIDYYLARPLGLRMLVTGPIEKTHQYQWLNRQRGPYPARVEVYLVSPSNSPVHPENISWLQPAQLLHTDTLRQYRSGAWVREWVVQRYGEVELPAALRP